MQDISGFGLQVRIVASVSFPSGFTVTQFADDADPFNFPDMQIADSAMGLNGDLVVWSTANPINPVISVIPNTEDDRNLSMLLEANRVGRGKKSVQDNITITAIYPDGRNITLINGKLTNGPAGKTVSSSGRLGTRAYTFAFENKVGD